MNERIKELAEQAKGFVDLNQHVGGDKGCMVYTYDGLEKFAELIVRECAEVAQDFVTVENNKLVEHVHISPWHLQDKIKEHFGVEE
jgi:hypothetical protein